MGVDGFDGEIYRVEDTDSDKLREIATAQEEYLTDAYRPMPLNLLIEQIIEVRDELLRRDVLVLADRYITSLGVNAVLYGKEDRDTLARLLLAEAKFPPGAKRPISHYLEKVLAQ